MDRVKELECLYEMWQQLYECRFYMESNDLHMGLAVAEKLFWVLNERFFKENEKAPFILSEDGCIREDEGDNNDLVKSGEIILHEDFQQSYLSSALLSYYRKSPYWDVELMAADFTNYGYSSDDSDELSDEEEVLRTIFCANTDNDCFFEDKCIESFFHKTGSPIMYFVDGTQESCDNCLALKSFLLPYYLRLEKKEVLKEHLPYVCMIEEGITVLSDVFGTGSVRVMEKGMESSYFVCFDKQGSAAYVFPYGTHAVNVLLMLAGILVDKAILYLDEQYHMIPDGIREKEVLEWKIK